MNPSALSNSRWKVKKLSTIIEEKQEKNCFVPFIALTETWLNSNIKDAQVHIPSYTVTRADRNGRGGGVLLYSHESIPLTASMPFDDGMCEGLICKFQTVKIGIITIYRPPQASKESFSKLLSWIKTFVAELENEKYQIILVGDFNFPFINWNSGSVDKCVGLDMQSSAENFLNFLWDSLLEQYVHVPTRALNILDLFVTNNQFLVTNVSTVEYTALSDHKLIDVMLSTQFHANRVKCCNRNEEISFKNLNFQKANFDAISLEVSQVPWTQLFDECPFQDFPYLFTLIMLQICLQWVPVKKQYSGKPKELHALKRKKRRIIRKIEANKARNGNPDHLTDLELKLNLVIYEMKEAICKSLDDREKRIVSKIKDNPRVFYSLAKSLSSLKSRIPMLISNCGEVVCDEERMTNLLQQQFSSVFSDPSAPEIKTPEFEQPEITYNMTENMFTITRGILLVQYQILKMIQLQVRVNFQPYF